MHVNDLAEGLGIVVRQGFGTRTYTNGGGAGFVGPTSTISQPAPTPIYTAPIAIKPLPPREPIYYGLPDTRSILTTEQLEIMRDRAIAAGQELEARQYREWGDGVAEDLEREANEINATDKAVAEGAGIRVSPTQPGNTGMLALAALAYFLFF